MSTNPISGKDSFPDPVSHSSTQHGAANSPSAKDRGWVGDFWALMGCNAIVFGASICIMVIELTASRLIAVHLGASLYTWTSVIGVVLAGISFGNYLGGWLADRFAASQKLLSVLFVIASVLCFSVLWLNQQASHLSRPEDMHWPTWVMLIVGGIFLLPAMSLGTISPVVATMALRRSSKAGMTVGNVYAWGAMGSIVGTFFTGFYLLDVIGTQKIIVLTSAALGVMGLVIGIGQWAFRSAVMFGWLQFVAIVGMYAAVSGDELTVAGRTVGRLFAGNPDKPGLKEFERDGRRRMIDRWAINAHRIGSGLHELGLALKLRDDQPGVYRDESNYYTITITDEIEDGDSIKELKLDHLIHSYWNPDNPTKLYYDYEKVYAAITERAASRWSRDASVVVASAAASGEFVRELPERVSFDSASKKLTIHGAMNLDQFRQLLKIGPDGDYWLALIKLWEASNAGRTNEFVTEPLEQLPVGVEIPEVQRGIVHYDAQLRALVASKRVPRDTLLELLALGNHRDYASAVIQLYTQSRHVSTLFIGGGGFVFPRWIESRFPGKPHIDVAEIDPAVKLAVQKELGLPDDGETAVRTHVGDARKFVDDQLRANRKATDSAKVRYDFAYGDAFNDFSVPWHLTTREFTEKIKELINPEHGIFLVNIIDIYPRAESDNLSEIPPLLTPAVLPPNTWTAAPDSFSDIEIYDDGDSYLLGYRGVMSDERHKSLVALSDKSEFREAIDELARGSRSERAGKFIGRYVATVREVFPFVYVFSSNEDAPGDNRDTFVVTCSMNKLDLANLKQAGGHWAGEPFAWTETENGERQNHGQMSAVLELARGMFLTDDFAPVDNLLAPVFVRR
ncbi:MAG: spermidine synthase [Planctomycetales bacterium]|nr:spermidine synthase [Planctomycetales bacterium]